MKRLSTIILIVFLIFPFGFTMLKILFDIDLPLWSLNLSMAALTVLMSAFFFTCQGDVKRWKEAYVSGEQRLKWSRQMGYISLIPAVIWPIGALISLVIEFDTDFILLTQIAVFVIAAFLPLVRLRMYTRHPVGGK